MNRRVCKWNRRTYQLQLPQDRFPDPERGVPEPGHGGDWFGHHMVISGSSYVSLGQLVTGAFNLQEPERESICVPRGFRSSNKHMLQ